VRNTELTGTALQRGAEAEGFEPSLVVLTMFPQVVNFMADNIDWTKELGQAFSVDREGVLNSIQRLRADAHKSGALKSTPQQTVETKTTTKGEQVIVIEPANPQVVYVRNTTRRSYATPPATTTQTVVIKEEDNSAGAAAAGAIVGSPPASRSARHRQRLLLRSVRVARRRLHVQRFLERLLRRPRRRAEDFYDHARTRAKTAGSPRRHRRRARRPGVEHHAAAAHEAQQNRQTARAKHRHDVQQRTEAQQNRQAKAAKARRDEPARDDRCDREDDRLDERGDARQEQRRSPGGLPAKRRRIGCLLGLLERGPSARRVRVAAAVAPAVEAAARVEADVDETHSIVLALALGVALALPLSAQTKQPTAFPTPRAPRALRHAARAEAWTNCSPSSVPAARRCWRRPIR
jgi:hypothetical protein